MILQEIFVQINFIRSVSMRRKLLHFRILKVLRQDVRISGILECHSDILGILKHCNLTGITGNFVMTRNQSMFCKISNSFISYEWFYKSIEFLSIEFLSIEMQKQFLKYYVLFKKLVSTKKWQNVLFDYFCLATL